MESELLVKQRQVVLPGDVMATGIDFLPGNGCYRDGDEVKSKLLGLVKVKDSFLGVVPFSGIYNPRSGDGIIATVTDLQNAFWILNINSPYDAILQISEGVEEFVDLKRTDITRYFDVGDVIYVKVLNVAKSKSITLTMNDYRAKKLIGGMTLKFTPSKVPRLIGKQGSMIELIKKRTGCQIIVGQNGIVWLKGEDVSKAIQVIRMIEKEAHTSGLTNRITEFLGGVVDDTQDTQENSECDCEEDCECTKEDNCGCVDENNEGGDVHE
jgi:exosome complex component RRP4